MSEAPPDKITPMLRQYLDLKSRYADALLLFQMGDFYETFFEDAEKAAGGPEHRPHLPQPRRGGAHPHGRVSHPRRRRLHRRLLEAGFKVVVCDQTEDPAQAKGLVRREVTRILTRGTVVDPGGPGRPGRQLPGRGASSGAASGAWPFWSSPPGSSASPQARGPRPWATSSGA